MFWLLLIFCTLVLGQNQIDPFKTAQTDKLNKSQILILASKNSELSVSEMICEVNDFLGKDTRTLSCGLSGNLNYYSGLLKIVFTDKTTTEKQVIVEQVINNGVITPWGSAAMGIYNYKDIDHVEFIADGAKAIWENTQAARDVLSGTYDYPKADTYPPPVKIAEMICHISEILVGKDQNTLTAPSYIVTCGIAGSQKFYSGKIAVWWHTFASRIPEKGDTPNIPQKLSTAVNANHLQHVTLAHDVSGAAFAYWGITSFILQLEERKSFDRFNFYLDSEEFSWTQETTPIYGMTRSSQKWYCKFYRKLFHKKDYYLH